MNVGIKPYVENCHEDLVHESLGFINTFGTFPTSIHESIRFIWFISHIYILSYWYMNHLDSCRSISVALSFCICLEEIGRNFVERLCLKMQNITPG